MRSQAPAYLLLLCLAGCADLTDVPPPPVPLFALGTSQAAATDPSWRPLTEGPSVRLTRVVPPKALVALHLPDIGGSIDRFKRTGLYKWLSSPELARELGPAAEMFTANFNLDPGSAPVDVNRIKKALQGEFVVALERIDLRDPRMPDVRVVGGITVRGAERDVRQLLEMTDMVAAAQKGIQVEKGALEGATFSRLVGKEPRPWIVELALYEDALLFGVGRETVTAAITRLQDEDEASLVDMPGYRDSWERCGNARDALRLHVNVGVALEQHGEHVPADLMRAIRALGLDRIRSLAVAVGIDGKDITTSTMVDSPGGEDFLSRLLAAHPVDRHFLERVPADAASFTLFALDGPKVLAALREAMPADARRDLDADLESLRRQGLDVERDVLEVFGPRCAIVHVARPGGAVSSLDAIWNQLLGTGIVLEIQDLDRAQEVLAKLPPELAGAERRTFVADGTQARSYRFNQPELPGELALAYAVDGEYLVVAPTEETLRRVLKGASPETAQRYRNLLEHVPETAAVVSYDDMRHGPGLLFDAMFEGFARGLAGSMPGRGLTSRRSPFSRTAALQNFGHSVSYTVADGSGIFSSTRSPTGGIGSSGGVFGFVALASIAIPNLHLSRIAANETAAVSTLRMVQVAQQTYRANALRDADSDGEGEYGFLVDLLGERRRGESRATSRRLLSAQLKRKKHGFVSRGYYFRGYLPAEDGSPVGEHERTSRIREVDGDLSEALMAVVAWPIDKGSTGNRAYFLDASGEIYVCENGPYSGGNAPPPDLRSSQEGNLASAPLRPGKPTRDGCRWTKLR